MLRVGFEVRLSIALDPGQLGAAEELSRPAEPETVEVTVTRATQRHLHLAEGQQVWVAHTEGARALPERVSLGSPLASGA